MAETGPCGYAVFLSDPALEALGKAVEPYLRDGDAGKHICARTIDTGGSFLEMTLDARTNEGQPAEIELIVPNNMVRMIVSTRSDGAFGFYMPSPAADGGLPVVGPDAPPAQAPTTAVPDAGAAAAAGSGGAAIPDAESAPAERGAGPAV